MGDLGVATSDGPGGSEPRTDDWADRRSDARRNHERVLAAAVEVFTEHGLDATIPQVAARAGVGKATVYRSYPTKADLVRALAEQHVTWLHELVEEAVAAAEHDALGALSSLLDTVTTRLAQDRLMVEVLSGVEDLNDPGTFGHGQRVLDLARAQGSLREDATIVDVMILVSGFARELAEREVTDPAVWRRYSSLVLAALRP